MPLLEDLFSLRTRRVITLVAAICGFGLYLMPGRNLSHGAIIAATPSLTKAQETANTPRLLSNFEDGVDGNISKIATFQKRRSIRMGRQELILRRL